MTGNAFAFRCRSCAEQCAASSVEEAAKSIGCGDCPVSADEGCRPSRAGTFVVLEGGRSDDGGFRLLEALILQQLRELQARAGADGRPFKRKAFRKRLADLLISLERLADADRRFAELADKRRKVQLIDLLPSP